MKEKNQKVFIDLWTCHNTGVTSTFYLLGIAGQNVGMFNLQCLYHHHYKYKEETLLIPPPSQLDTTKYVHIHKRTQVNLVSGTQRELLVLYNAYSTRQTICTASSCTCCFTDVSVGLYFLGFLCSLSPPNDSD